MTERKLRAVLRDAKSMSYTLVAERHGLTRNQVAGVIWRHKNPYSVIKNLPNSRSPNSLFANKCGRGWHGPGPLPSMTAANTR